MAKMIPVTVTNVSISNVGFVVFLKSDKDDRRLPIFIGVPEAQAIAIELNDVTPPRPMTHDLMKNVLDILEARLERVVIHSLEKGTFHGKLVLACEGQLTDVDSRPSDAIALALRYKAPILVAEAVMDEAGVLLDEENEEPEEEPAPVEDHVTKLKSDLERAIEEERYEDAAQLRDEIRKATRSN
jgi:hypothetical protein